MDDCNKVLTAEEKTNNTMEILHNIVSRDRSSIQNDNDIVNQMNMMINELKRNDSKETVKIQIGNNTLSIAIDAPFYDGWDSLKEAMIKLMESRRNRALTSLDKMFGKYSNIDQYIKENNLEY